jgi:hypothetical protein
MTLRETLVLTPFEKWSKYRRFPFKFFLRLILVIASTSHILLLTSESVAYTLSGRAALLSSLFGGIDGDISTQEDLITAVRSSVSGYDSLTNSSLGLFQYQNDAFGNTAKVNLTVESFNLDVIESKGTGGTTKYTIQIDKDDIGPLNPDAKVTKRN